MRLGRHGRALRFGGWSIRYDLRALAATAAVVLVGLAVNLVALTTGDYPVSLGEVVRALVGDSSATVHMVVVDWRLSRVVLGWLIGAALGIGGAVFQSLSRNPLGSPDIIGFNTGAATGALLVIVVLEGSYAQRAGGALLGGFATAAVVYLLAYRRGSQGFRLVLVGIAVSSMLASVNSYLLMHADLDAAMAGAVWQIGSLDGTGWAHVRPVVLVLVVLVPVALALARPMRMLDLGDDAARGLGTNAEAVRAGLVLTGVGLTAAATAVAGPIAFVALAAPQLAKRLTRSPGLSIVPAACMGSVLLVSSDLAAQRLFAPTQLPVGVMTVSIGGAYLVWLLARERKRGRG